MQHYRMALHCKQRGQLGSQEQEGRQAKGGAGHRSQRPVRGLRRRRSGAVRVGREGGAGGADRASVAQRALFHKYVGWRAANPLACQCCVTTVSQVGFEIYSFRHKPWLLTRTVNKNRTWSCAWTRTPTRFCSHCLTQCLNQTRNDRYRCLFVCDSFQSRSLTRRRPVRSHRLCLTRERTRPTQRSGRPRRQERHQCPTLGHTRRQRACSRPMPRVSRINSRPCIINIQNKDHMMSAHISQMNQVHFHLVGSRLAHLKDRYIISSKNFIISILNSFKSALNRYFFDLLV